MVLTTMRRLGILYMATVNNIFHRLHLLWRAWSRISHRLSSCHQYCQQCQPHTVSSDQNFSLNSISTGRETFIESSFVWKFCSLWICLNELNYNHLMIICVQRLQRLCFVLTRILHPCTLSLPGLHTREEREEGKSHNYDICNQWFGVKSHAKSETSFDE